MSPEQMGALVVAVSEGIDQALVLLAEESPGVAGAEGCLRAARAALTALAIAVDDLIPPDEKATPNTDDPATCGHNPPYLDLPGQMMCKTCGASQLEDGSWAML